MSDPGRSTRPSRLIDRLRDRAWLGASWLPRWRDEGFLLAVDPDPELLTLTAVGGKVEVGESFADAARREWEEETGCPAPQPVFVSRPVWIGAPEDPTADTEGAAAVLRTVPTTGTPDPPPLWILVFLARMDVAPRAVEKHPAFVVVPSQDLERLAYGGIPPRLVRIFGDLPSSAAGGGVLRDTPRVLGSFPGALSAMWRWAATT